MEVGETSEGFSLWRKKEDALSSNTSQYSLRGLPGDWVGELRLFLRPHLTCCAASQYALLFLLKIEI